MAIASRCAIHGQLIVVSARSRAAIRAFRTSPFGLRRNSDSLSERLQKQTQTPGILSKSYQYNKADDVTYISGTSITYDDLHRIKTYTGLAGSYAYDSVGNINTSIEGGSSAYTYGNARKQAVKTAFGKTYLYDLCGNMIVRGNVVGQPPQALDYDAENRLTRLSQSGASPLIVEYGYAADGIRLWKRKNQTELQVWIGKLYEEKQGKTLFHVFAGDQRVCTFELGSVLGGGSGGASTHVGYYYHQDHLNSSSALSGSAGQLLEGNTWYAFGSVQTASPQANFQVSGRFTGQVLDAETGLYYYNARYYDPGLGRFIQPDTIIPDLANPQSYNRYSYVLNNPLRYVDPDGHWPQWMYNWIPDSWVNAMYPNYVGPSYMTSSGQLLANAPNTTPAINNLGMLQEELGGYDTSQLQAAAGVMRAGVSMTPAGAFNSGYTAISGNDAYNPSQKVQPGDRIQAGAETAAAALPIAKTVAGASVGAKAVIDSGKFGYLFGKASGRGHNVARAAENARQLGRIGVHNIAEGTAPLQEHFNEVVADSSNIIRSFANQYGKFQVRESLFSGPGGFLKFESTWQIIDNDTYRFVTAIPFGGQ